MRHLKYLSYVLRHKWYVFIECYKLGITWRGIVHDIDKFFPSEWFPYVDRFFGDKGKDIKTGRDETGYYVPTESGSAEFHLAWNYHQKRNKHHWQWWVIIGEKILPMDDASRKEMLADWRGAGRAQGTPDVIGWYSKNKDKMQLHPETRAWVEQQLASVD